MTINQFKFPNATKREPKLMTHFQPFVSLLKKTVRVSSGAVLLELIDKIFFVEYSANRKCNEETRYKTGFRSRKM